MMSEANTISLAPPKSSTRLASTSPLNQMVSMHNPIQLAAISNYKLAQLTFATPDLHSMRKTALVKNMLEMLYEDTPSEWLDQMTRWVFFTPESLSDMTQEHLEEIFAQYAQTIEAFQPLSLDDDDDGDGDDADMWADIDDDHLVCHQADDHCFPETSIVSAPPSPVHITTCETVSSINDILPSNLPPSPVSLVDKSPPDNTSNSVEVHHVDIASTIVTAAAAPIAPSTPAPNPTSASSSSANRKSLTSGLRAKNRLSWTSDTGVAPSSAIVQHMASEMMTLFDMDFSVDIKVDTAPKLPELSFRSQNDLTKHRRSAQRFSDDSLMGLINKFETFGIEDDQICNTYNTQTTTPKRRSRLSHQMIFPPPPVEGPPDHVRNKERSTSLPVSNPPARSSSLKYRNQRSLAVSEDPKARAKSRSNELLSTLAHALGGGSSHHPQNSKIFEETAEPDQTHEELQKNRSVLRIASSLVKGSSNKHKKSAAAATVAAVTTPSSSSLNSTYQMTHSQTTINSNIPHQSDEPRKSISSTISSSSSWSSTSEVLVARKTSLRRQPTNGITDNHNSSNSIVTPAAYNNDPTTKRRSFAALQPVVVEAQDLRRARSLGHSRYPTSKRKKNRRSSLLMEKTASKRKSIQQLPQPPPPPAVPEAEVALPSTNNIPLRRKSTFIRIGRGSSDQRPKDPAAGTSATTRQSDAHRRTTSALPSPSPPPPPRTPFSSADDITEPVEKSFVKRMATLGRRMRLQRV
ncbi:hypothetical protein BX666DRAFT_1226785 [Dichotomocladium elegans]|nr:hypothetical protein BX666DRAFT_1226785 [Dichotomocladium elegans]